MNFKILKFDRRAMAVMIAITSPQAKEMSVSGIVTFTSDELDYAVYSICVQNLPRLLCHVFAKIFYRNFF